MTRLYKALIILSFIGAVYVPIQYLHAWGGGFTFTGGPVIDHPKGSTLMRILAIQQNILNQFDSLKANNDTKLAVITAISNRIGEASPAEINPALDIPETSQVNQLAKAIEERFSANPEDFNFHKAMVRYRSMNERLVAYSAHLQDLSKKGSKTLNFTERQRLKAELGLLENHIKTDRDFLTLMAEAEKLRLKHEAAEIRERESRDANLDRMLQ